MSDNYRGDRRDDDDLAYGEDYNTRRGQYEDQGQGTDRGLIGDTFRKFRSKYDQYQQPQQDFGYGSSSTVSSQPYSQSYSQSGAGGSGAYSANQPPYSGGPPPQQPPYQQSGQTPGQRPGQKPDIADKLFGAIHGAVHSIGSDVAGILGTKYDPHQSQSSHQGPGLQSNLQSQGTAPVTTAGGRNRYDSTFPGPKDGNQVKWYVDGCAYMWAVSEALENARQSVWILDWWLSPELYLRRPPAANEEWRIDRVLQRIANRGVKVNVIVYKEVTQALTLSSAHTKHVLEALSPNIGVFRHPDHLPDAQTAHSSILSALQGLKLDAAGASKLGADALKGVYGINDDVILYWAHHEKLCLIDGHLAFMGGLDLCYGRWDTNQHPIADAHPSDLNKIVFPGQDFNNARVMDFSEVDHPFQNKLDRTKSSRMGWSDISICLRGPCIEDLRHHFTDRWNFIYDEKYNVRKDARYTRLPPVAGHSAQEYAALATTPSSSQQQTSSLQPGQYPPPPGQQGYTPPPWQGSSRPTTPSGLTTYPPKPYSPQPESQQYGTSQTNTNLPPPPPGPPPHQQSYEASQNYGGYQNANLQTSQQNTYGSSRPDISQTPYDPQSEHRPPATSQAPYQQQPSYGSQVGTSDLPYQQQSSYGSQTDASIPPYQQQSYRPVEATRGFDDEDQYEPQQNRDRGLDAYEGSQRSEYDNDRGLGGGRFGRYRDEARRFKDQSKRLGGDLGSFGHMVDDRMQQKIPGHSGSYSGRPASRGGPSMSCQLVRSCAKWSNGTQTEHSIQNAYIDIIQKSRHFVYIENQFFITATGDKQKPVKNLIGKALVERIVRAAREGQQYKVFVIMPAVPAFAGDLVEDAALGTRAIMEFQYDSICRGGNSIMEEVAKAGFNPMDYIRFYNLRNYDRINISSSMQQAQQQSGVNYDDARTQFENQLGTSQHYGGYGQASSPRPGQPSNTSGNQYGAQYQAAAQATPNTATDKWDSVSSCYMLGGQDIRSVPWSGSPETELSAFVSEELYVHSKVLIADDQVVICGSANINDRSMLGYHDSEIALIINDPTPVQSSMAGRPWQASRFAASLRRQLFRKHLGLVPPQDMRRPNANFHPVDVPNEYDWGSPEDNVVSDPLSDTFQSLWNSRARTNTEVFRQAFRAVPDDNVRSWPEYKEFYEYYFSKAEAQAGGKDKTQKVARVEYGHVVRDDFPGGVQQLKELLSKVKGTLVEMPLCFLQTEDIAKEGISLNALTEELYT